MQYKNIYEKWLNDAYFDEGFRQELQAIANDEKEIEDRFYRDLEFGTAGMRGVIGAGRNRINAYIVRKASQGFANFLLERKHKVLKESKKQAVAIAYDSRRFSKEFALETAYVMAANGIKSYLFSDVRTTPELSFAVRYLNCMGGIMITASHNPPEYNGYKVYDETGCQLVPHLAESLIQHVSAVDDFSKVKLFTEDEARTFELLEVIDIQVDKPYEDMVADVSLRPEILKETALKAVYTPLHGTGAYLVQQVLKNVGFKGLIPVTEQMAPDGEFPTCKEPNPENEGVFERALVYAHEHGADIVIATDPDCDRIGFMVRHEGKYVMINGNQIGSLFMEYILSSKKHLSGENYVVNTVVSSDLARAQAKHYGVRLIQTLTGFKFIGEQIEKNTSGFVMGYEESYGYLFAPHVRDKDAVMGTMIAIEMAAYYMQQGKTLVDVLGEVFARHGFFVEETVSLKFEGKEGQAQMASILERFRKETLFAYREKIDYLLDDTGLPPSDVLKFYMDENSWVVLRPSGTEPKLKVYFSVSGKDEGASREKLSNYKNLILEKVRS